MKKMINIVGIGLSPEDLSLKIVKVIEQADILAGGRRHLAYFPGHRAKKIVIKKNIQDAIDRLKKDTRAKRVVVLASGDPNFFGIASRIVQAFGKERVSIEPNITAFQAAFARIKEPWDDAAFVSLHGRDLSCLDKALEQNGSVVIYCDNNNAPDKVSRYLIDIDGNFKKCRAWVFENLGQHDERITAGTLKTFQTFPSSPLAMMIVKTKSSDNAQKSKKYFGILDEDFYHQKGMITRRDVRILVLSRLACENNMVMWDIGAGSGSVSIEAAVLYPSLQVYAVEKRPDRFKLLVKNIKKFKTHHVHPLFGSAPEVLKKLPRPRSVFIGGSGGKLESILQEVKRNIPDDCTVVINCVMLETLARATEVLKRWKWRYTVTAVQLAGFSSNDNPEIMRAENQVFILHGKKA